MSAIARRIAPEPSSTIVLTLPPPAPPRPHGATAEILPFPVVRRRDFIERAIATGERYPPRGRIGHLLSVVNRHAARLDRLGVAPDQAAVDVAALAGALGLGVPS